MKSISFCIPTMGFGGMQRVVTNFCNYYVKNDYSVKLYVLYGEEVFYKLDNRINVIFLKPKKRNTFHLISYLTLLLKFRNDIKLNKPDYLILFGSYQSLFLALFLTGLNINTFISERQNPKIHRGIIAEMLKFIIYPRITGFFAQTNFVKNYIDNKYNTKRTFVVHNPIDITTPRSNFESRDNIIIRTGRLVPEKRFDQLIEIFSKINNNDWELHIIGDGPCKEDLISQVNSLNLSEKVKFLGVKDNVFDYLNKAKIFAFTSKYEGFPNALCEAMCLGLSCISYDIIAGPADMIKNKYNGILIEDSDIQSFVVELDKLLLNEDLQRDFYQNTYSLWKKLSLEYISDKLVEEMDKCILLKNN